MEKEGQEKGENEGGDRKHNWISYSHLPVNSFINACALTV